MTTPFLSLSIDEKRAKHYRAFLSLCEKHQARVKDILALGVQVMSRQKLHHHFFGDYSWKATAQALLDYALNPTHPDTLLTPEQARVIFALFERRIVQRVPVEYITQQASYCGHSFYVNEHVLIPRSIMSARFKEFLNETHWNTYRVLDLCTGSGCIGITLALLNPKIQVDLADISCKALEVAQRNIEQHGLQDRVGCIHTNGFDNIHHDYDLIITNPPYVSHQEYEKSPAEFKQEPKIALESGVEGLDLVHRILRKAKHYLSPQGTLIAEVGSSAAKRLKKHYPNIKFTWFKYKRPNGSISWFSTPGVFLCKKEDLQAIESSVDFTG